MISVIIPTFNRGYVLKKTLPSYFSKLVDEIIVVDDGSTDDTKEIIEDFSTKFSIKYIRHKKRLGLPSARNTGIKFVSENSGYIFFGEDDVFLTENCYEIVFEIFKKNFLDLLAINVKYLAEDEDFEKYFLKEIKVLYPKTFDDILKFKSLHLAKKEIYENFKFDEKYILSSYREETDFYLRVSKKYKIALIENYLAFNLPRSMCDKGGEWGYNPFIYEFSTIYNNFRFFIKNKDIINMNFKEILIQQIKFTVERLRSLKAKILR